MASSKIFVTPDPDSRYHWLYTDYISNERIGEKYLKTWKFEITYNPYLSKKYVDSQKQLNGRSFAHYWRNILGEWVMAEGRVYEHFNEDNIIHDFKYLPEHFDALDIDTDYGVTNANCFVFVGTVFN